MYAKNNLGTLGRLHSNALMKSQSPTGFKFKPLSQIENSLQKIKARKKKGSKSKSRSKQNTPQNDKSAQRRTSIGSQKGSIYFNKPQQQPKQPLMKRYPKKSATHFSQHINSIVSSYDNISVKTPSQLSIQSRNLVQSNNSSCVSSQYQLPMNSQCSQKSVKFSDRHIEINMSRMNSKKFSEKEEDRIRTPSILKKRFTSNNSVNSQRSSSVKSSFKLSRARDLIEVQNLTSNKLTKAKYEALIKKYQDLNKKFAKNQLKNYTKLEKYTDDIFPPQNSSVFSYSIHNKTQKPKTNITWKRIPELFTQNENLIVLREQPAKSLIKITRKDMKNQPCLAEDYFVFSLNCIRENKKLLDKMFEFKETNISGVYLVKLFMENTWKYVIVDDLIPTIYDETKQVYIPAFINVQKAEGNTSDTIQVWPYLLEKAMAVYYSKYQALKYGNEIDLLAEITGVPYRISTVSQIDFENKQHLEIQNLLRQERAVILGEKIVDQKSTFYCILPDLNSITKKSQGFCTTLTKEKAYKPVKQKLETFLATLTRIYVYQLEIYPNIHLSYLCPQSKKPSEGSFRSKPSLQPQKKQDSDISLRCFTIIEATRGILSIRQKDCKFYFQGKVQYKYIWIRAIILLKQHNGDYRWIDGQYANTKAVNFFLSLEPGEYYLLLMPEWNPAYKYDVTMSFFTECNIVALDKRPYPVGQDIFEKGCADIAQRSGSMNQINKYICAYNYVTQKTGLVIENINNERQSGPVTVMRSLNGLKCQVSLVPVNKEFYFSTNADYDNEAVKRLRKTVEVDIDAGQQFTVVLKTVGGIDHKFFDSFDFGS